MHSPAGTLYVAGVANGATVSITGSNPYTWSVTLPTLTAGESVQVYVTATVASIATAAVVFGDIGDTSLTSDIYTNEGANGASLSAIPTIANVTTVATVTNLTNAPPNSAGVTSILADYARRTGDYATVAALATLQGNVTTRLADYARRTGDYATVAALATLQGNVTTILADYARRTGDYSVLAAGAAMTLTSAYDAAKAAASQASVNAIPTNPLLANSALLPATVIAAKADIPSVSGLAVEANVQGHVTDALNAAIPASPTSNSIFDYIKSKLSQYAGGDTAGTTTLLGRIIGTLLTGNHSPQSGDSFGVVKSGGTGDLVALKAVTPASVIAAKSDLPVAPDNSGITDIKNTLGVAGAGLTALPAGTLSTTALDAILDRPIEGSYTLRHAMEILLAEMAGKASGGGTATIVYRNPSDTKNRVILTVDINGNRSLVVTDLT